MSYLLTEEELLDLITAKLRVQRLDNLRSQGFFREEEQYMLDIDPFEPISSLQKTPESTATSYRESVDYKRLMQREYLSKFKPHIDNQLIEHLEAKARVRIIHELKFEHMKDGLTEEGIILASMPLISETKSVTFSNETSVHEAHEHIREKVFNYFYAEIFDYMKAILRKET